MLPISRTVTLIDESGNAVGTADLLDAHTGEGKLHLAISVYIMNPERTSMLIQRRSSQKMLWPLFLANAACSHPLEGETPIEAGERRILEELGLRTSLKECGVLLYRAEDPGRGVEHEYDILLIGTADELTPLHPDPAEVAETRWVVITELTRDMKDHPEKYAPWFHLGFPKVFPHS